MQHLSMMFPDLLQLMWNQQKGNADNMQLLGLFAQVCRSFRVIAAAVRSHPRDTFLMARYTRSANVYLAKLPETLNVGWKDYFGKRLPGDYGPLSFLYPEDDFVLRCAVQDVTYGLCRFLHHKPTVDVCVQEFALIEIQTRRLISTDVVRVMAYGVLPLVRVMQTYFGDEQLCLSVMRLLHRIALLPTSSDDEFEMLSSPAQCTFAAAKITDLLRIFQPDTAGQYEAPVSVVDTPAVDEQLGLVATGKIVRNWFLAGALVVELVQERAWWPLAKWS